MFDCGLCNTMHLYCTISIDNVPWAFTIENSGGAVKYVLYSVFSTEEVL